MTPDLFQALLQQTETLTSEEKLRLIAHLADSLRQTQTAESTPAQPKRKWSEIRGVFKEPVFGEDAQEWISRSRREADERRERAIRGDFEAR